MRKDKIRKELHQEYDRQLEAAERLTCMTITGQNFGLIDSCEVCGYLITKRFPEHEKLPFSDPIPNDSNIFRKKGTGEYWCNLCNRKLFTTKRCKSCKRLELLEKDGMCCHCSMLKELGII